MSRPAKLWLFRIQDMIDSINRISNITEGFNYEDYMGNEDISDISERHLITIGEAARHIPKDIQEKYSNIEWRKVMGMRHIVVHDYDEVNDTIIWNVVQDKLPDLKKQLEVILRENKS